MTTLIRLEAAGAALILLGWLAVALSSCAPPQRTALDLACADATVLAPLASGIPGAAAIVPGVMIGCATAEGLARLAADPSSAEWVGHQIGSLRSLAAAVGRKL